MSIFQDVVMTWQETEYTLPANKVMKTIAKVEDVITLQEMATAAANESLPLARLAEAFHVVLTSAGVQNVALEDVYAEMFSDGDRRNAAAQYVNKLLMLMVPPSARKADDEPGEGDEVGKSEAQSEEVPVS